MPVLIYNIILLFFVFLYYFLPGRKKETDIFQNLLENFKESKLNHVIIYEGLMGYGKSQLITEIVYLGQAPRQKLVLFKSVGYIFSEIHFLLSNLFIFPWSWLSSEHYKYIVFVCSLEQWQVSVVLRLYGPERRSLEVDGISVINCLFMGFFLFLTALENHYFLNRAFSKSNFCFHRV